MSENFNFLVPEKIIEVKKPPVNNIVTIDVAHELYTEAKEEWFVTEELSRYSFPFRSTVGGYPLGGDRVTGTYFFFSNDEGWRIRPADMDHDLVLNGNLLAVDPDLPIFISTPGGHSVIIHLNTSEAIEGDVSLTDVALDDIAERVRKRIFETTSFPP